MGLLFDMETRLEQEHPLRLQESLGGYRPQCRQSGLLMLRHHRYSRSIAIRYGVLELQIPVFRYCNRGAGSRPGSTLGRRLSRAAERRWNGAERHWERA